MSTRFEALRYDYAAFIRSKNAIMERVSNALESVNEDLIEDLSDAERQELEEMQSKLEGIYEGLEEVISW